MYKGANDAVAFKSIQSSSKAIRYEHLTQAYQVEKDLKVMDSTAPLGKAIIPYWL